MLRSKIEIEVRDKNGKLIYRKCFERNSWLKNFMALLKVLFGDDGTTLRNSDDVTINVSRSDLATATVKGAEGDMFTGVAVGAGSLPPAPDDYMLDAQIPHGDADGYLHYQACSIMDLVVDGNSTILKITRDFTNNGTVDITINEVGLYISIVVGGTAYAFLLFREVLPSPVTVPAGATITVRVVGRVTA